MTYKKITTSFILLIITTLSALAIEINKEDEIHKKDKDFLSNEGFSEDQIMSLHSEEMTNTTVSDLDIDQITKDLEALEAEFKQMNTSSENNTEEDNPVVQSPSSSNSQENIFPTEVQPNTDNTLIANQKNNQVEQESFPTFPQEIFSLPEDGETASTKQLPPSEADEILSSEKQLAIPTNNESPSATELTTTTNEVDSSLLSSSLPITQDNDLEVISPVKSNTTVTNKTTTKPSDLLADTIADDFKESINLSETMLIDTKENANIHKKENSIEKLPTKTTKKQKNYQFAYQTSESKSTYQLSPRIRKGTTSLITEESNFQKYTAYRNRYFILHNKLLSKSYPILSNNQSSIYASNNSIIYAPLLFKPSRSTTYNIIRTNPLTNQCLDLLITWLIILVVVIGVFYGLKM